jgi:hypothetical protein
LNGRDDKHQRPWQGAGELLAASAADDHDDHDHDDHQAPRPSERLQRHAASPACDPKQRLLPASQRDEICFWFKLDDGLSRLIRRDGEPPTPAGGERLVEAELHVFKLFPQTTTRARAQEEGAAHSVPDDKVSSDAGACSMAAAGRPSRLIDRQRRQR